MLKSMGKVIKLLLEIAAVFALLWPTIVSISEFVGHIGNAASLLHFAAWATNHDSNWFTRLMDKIVSAVPWWGFILIWVAVATLLWGRWWPWSRAHHPSKSPARDEPQSPPSTHESVSRSVAIDVQGASDAVITDNVADGFDTVVRAHDAPRTIIERNRGTRHPARAIDTLSETLRPWWARMVTPDPMAGASELVRSLKKFLDTAQVGMRSDSDLIAVYNREFASSVRQASVKFSESFPAAADPEMSDLINVGPNSLSDITVIYNYLIAMER